MRVVVVLAGIALLGAGACSDDDDDDDAASTTTVTAVAQDTTTTTGAEPSTTTTTEAPVDADPIDAAAAFLATFFPDTTATLSEFRQGDPQSGEVEVLRPREGGGTANLASTLLLRLDGDQWEVIAAVNPMVTIDSPANGDQVSPGPLTVSGKGRGFEAHIDVSAVELDGTVAATGFGSGGALAEPEPYEVELDLSAGPAGTELLVIARGGTGLDGDTGEFSAIRITVA